MDATYETAVKELRSGNIYPIYVLYGKENFLKKRMLDDIVKRAVSEDTAEYNYSVFDGEKSVDDFCDAAESAPFFAERRVVTLKDTELSKLPADKSARVADIIELCDRSVFIPMMPNSESLNAAHAATVLLWEKWKKGRA